MTKSNKQILIAAIVIAVIAGFFLSIFYAQQGPAEKIGSKIDEGVESTQAALTPAGPIQKAGQKADQAIGTNK